MVKSLLILFACAAFAVAGLCPAARAAEDEQANALLLIPSDKTAFDKGFQDFLDKGGVRLLQSYPPSVFVGYVPPAMDKELGEKYGARVYRGRVDDWGSFARYGEKAVFAVNTWNKRFVDDPPAAPLVVSAAVKKVGRKGELVSLTWNEVMKATAYRLQISTDPSFSSISLQTLLPENKFRLPKAFWSDGVYYWRTAAILRLNNGTRREGDLSETFSFAVSRQGKGGTELPPPALKVVHAARALAWPEVGGARWYRLQVARDNKFTATVLDVFTSEPGYKLTGLPLPDGEYYMRVKACDGVAAGGWSDPAQLTLEPR